MGRTSCRVGDRSQQAGVYDTVYVDLDNDYDFRDEKPLARADVNDPSTYNDMIAYRDFDGDGLSRHLRRYGLLHCRWTELYPRLRLHVGARRVAVAA
ncbi:MAG: hypothetical protein R2873_16755 [Caldilineaceae bacterium]